MAAAVFQIIGHGSVGSSEVQWTSLVRTSKMIFHPNTYTVANIYMQFAIQYGIRRSLPLALHLLKVTLVSFTGEEEGEKEGEEGEDDGFVTVWFSSYTKDFHPEQLLLNLLLVQFSASEVQQFVMKVLTQEDVLLACRAYHFFYSYKYRRHGYVLAHMITVFRQAISCIDDTVLQALYCAMLQSSMPICVVDALLLVIWVDIEKKGATLLRNALVFIAGTHLFALSRGNMKESMSCKQMKRCKGKGLRCIGSMDTVKWRTETVMCIRATG